MAFAILNHLPNILCRRIQIVYPFGFAAVAFAGGYDVGTRTSRHRGFLVAGLQQRFRVAVEGEGGTWERRIWYF
jgi:hypothetical protein